jgi:16S rRNA (cytosine967-C5)-methyltransferase
VALERGLGTLPERDRRLAHELAAGVLRRSAALDQILAPLLKRGIASTDATILDVLRLGAYQIRHLERVPKHAAVATAVDLVREAVGDRSTGFVNAVLRRVTPESTGTTSPTRDSTETLAEEGSHPEWLVSRWAARFGFDETRRLLEWNNQQPPLVVQPTDGNLDRLSAIFTDSNTRHFPAPFGAGLVVEETRPARLPGFEQGEFFVQDPAQALVIRFAGIPNGSVVYDACAAPGGKAMAISRVASVVVAGDVARRRLTRLRENLQRTHADNCWPVIADALHPPIRQVDAVFLDAPCLGTGTFARHPDARLRVRPEALQRIVAEQAKLLDAAAERVRPGGILCYATCSLEQEEDELQVNAFLDRHPEFHRSPAVGEPLPVTDNGDLLILPHRDGMDGAYAARMVRTT